MKQTRKNLHNVFLILIAVGLGAIYYFASGSQYNEAGSFHRMNFNLLVYVGSLAAAFLLWLILNGITDFFLGSRDEETAGMSPLAKVFELALYPVYSAVAAGAMLLIYEIYANETNPELYASDVAASYIRQRVDHRIYFVIILVIAAALFFTLSRREVSCRPQRIGLAVVFAIVNAAAVWAPNLFADAGGGVDHIHAVTNSIVHVANLQPYSLHNISIYGHFGLICLPFVKLFGNNLAAISLTLSLFAFIAFLSAFYVADKIIRKNAAYFLTLLGITGTTTILTRRGQYLQVNPLRLLFPMLMLAALTFAAYHNRTKRDRILAIVLEIITGVLAVVWNFETGLFSVCVCACVIVIRSLFRARPFTNEMWIAVLRAIVYGAVCLAGAYGLVAVYNLLTGGNPVGPRQFIYPLFSGTYNVNNLRAPLPSEKFLYFFQILLFLFTLLIVLRKQSLEDTADERVDLILAAISLSGLSSMIYFMNRAAYANMSITHIQMLLILGAWGQYALSISRKNALYLLKRPSTYIGCLLSVVLFFGLVWLAIEGTLYIGICYDNRAKSSWNTDSLETGIEQLKSEMPENCPGFGHCVPELWFEMGWDNSITMTDWADMNDYNRDYVTKQLRHLNMVICVADEYEMPEGWHQVKEVEIKPYVYQLWIRDGLEWNGESYQDFMNGTAGPDAAVAAAQPTDAAVAAQVTDTPAVPTEASAESAVESMIESAAESAVARAAA